MLRVTNHQMVAFLAVLLALCAGYVMSVFGAPQKIVIGTIILNVILISIFWTFTELGPYDPGEDDDET